MLGPASQDRDLSVRNIRALARLCSSLRPEWDVTVSPFTRPVVDLGTVLRQIELDADGRLVGPRSRTFWTRVFTGGVPGISATSQWADQLARSDPADAEWFLHQFFDVDVATSLARFRAFRFLQRRFADVAEHQVALARATRAAISFPVLTLVLERIGVRDAVSFAAAADAAATIQRLEQPDRARATMLQFQGALALIDRAHFVATLDNRAAAALVGALVRITPSSAKDYEGALADSIVSAFVPAINRAPAGVAADPESLVVAALAGAGSSLVTAPGADRVEWEGLEYKADPATAESARIVKVVQRQSSATLTDALTFRRLVSSLAKATGQGDDRDAAAALRSLVARIPVMPSAGDQAAGGAGRLPDLVDGALRDATAHPGGIDRARAVERLTAAGDALLADALAALAYAVHLGAPDGLVVLAPDAARRHSVAARLAPLGLAWDLPVEIVGGGQTWHVIGSLLALDYALGPLALIDRLGDDMPPDPRLTAPDRRALAHGMALMSPFALADRERDTMAAALARGRARVEAALAGAEDPRALADAAGWSPWRRGALDYSLAHDPEGAPRLFTLTDYFWLGGGPDLDTAALDPWGSACNGDWRWAVEHLAAAAALGGRDRARRHRATRWTIHRCDAADRRGRLAPPPACRARAGHPGVGALRPGVPGSARIRG